MVNLNPSLAARGVQRCDVVAFPESEPDSNRESVAHFKRTGYFHWRAADDYAHRKLQQVQPKRRQQTKPRLFQKPRTVRVHCEDDLPCLGLEVGQSCHRDTLQCEVAYSMPVGPGRMENHIVESTHIASFPKTV